MKEEVEKLLEAGFIEEIDNSDWLSIFVLVMKANGKWRMCVDFSDVNKPCPKDSYPLPSIDEQVLEGSPLCFSFSLWYRIIFSYPKGLGEIIAREVE